MRTFLIALLVTWVFTSSAHPDSAMRVGGNLTIGESADQHVFLDLFCQARPWQTRQADGSGPFDTEKAALMPVNTNGWPLAVPFDPRDGSPLQLPHTVIGSRGAGEYTLTLLGKGRLSFTADNRLLDTNSPFLRSVTVNAPGGSNTFTLRFHTNARQLVFVDLLESDPGDPLRDIRLFPPGVRDKSGSTGAFRPEFLDSVKQFSVLRFMDWGQINGNPVERWDQRTLPTTYTQLARAGVAYEFMFDLANRAQRSAWICIPHRANADYVRQLARLAKASLAPDLKLFVEFSNETWNFSPGFDQAFELDDQAKALGLTSDEMTARKSAEAWGIFEEEFGPIETANRLIKVIASQAGRVELSAARLDALKFVSINGRHIRADALAIAPYFGGAVADAVAQNAESLTVDQLIQAAAASLRGEVAEWTRAHHLLAEQHGLWLVNYEAGQHLAATGGNRFNEMLTEKLIAANRDPRMKELYLEYLDQQQREGAALTLLYYHVGAPSIFGSWGLLEDLLQSTNEAPKWSAFIEWHGSSEGTNIPPRAEPGPLQRIFAVNGESALVRLNGTASRDLDGQITTFNWRVNGTNVLSGSAPQITLPLGKHRAELTVTDSAGAPASNTVEIVVAPAAARETLLSIHFTGSDPALRLPWTNATLGALATWTGFAANPAVNLKAGNDRLHFWVSGSGSGSVQTLSEALAANERFNFTIAPATGEKFDLRGAHLRLHWRRLSGHAPRAWALFSSKDGFSEAAALGVSAPVESIDEPFEMTFQLPFDGWGAIDAPVEFRLVPFGERFHGHEAAIESIQLSGAAVVSRPSLKIVRNEDGVLTLTWPISPYRLMEADSLTTPTIWRPSAAPVITAGGARTAQVQASARSKFYSLARE
ncbi:MAG TPA: hypothetical protein VEH27_18150 [Methylomirabilota bacterium]|nr:hypothetical protein [Methylomirabilota bacterium]